MGRSRFWSWLARPAHPAVRSLDMRDAPRIAAIHSEGFHRGWSVPEIEAMLADATIVGLGIGRGRALEGFVLSRRAADEAEILTIAVATGARRSGLGLAVLLAHLSQLAGRGVRALFLEVDEGNAAARALYDSLDFREVGRRNAYYRRPDGSRATALVLRKELA
jgi:ribosomal-protein-alanine N-acetyltransferase